MKKTAMSIIFLSFLAIPCGASAQQEKTDPAAGAAASRDQPPQTMEKHGHEAGCCDHHKIRPHHGQMMAEHQKMMKEMDARLEAKIAAMDAATGDKKLEAMADVIKELVSQRKEMQKHMMMMMREKMMEHKKHPKAKGEGVEKH